MLNQTDEQIDAITHQIGRTSGLPSGRKFPLLNHEAAHIKILRNYLRVFQLNTGMLPGDLVDPYRIVRADYDWFRMSHYIQETPFVNRGYYFASFGARIDGVPAPLMVPVFNTGRISG